MQNEITRSIPLLNSKGHITEEGWARAPLWQYDRRKIRAPWFRIKEWDYYYVLSDDLKRGVTLTVSDLGYAGLMALCWLDFEKGTATQMDTIAPFTGGRITASGSEFTPDRSSLRFEDKQLFLQFISDEGTRRLAFKAPGFTGPQGEKGLEGEIVLSQPPDLESMNIATSWAENRKRFYYNRKITNMPAEGTVTVGNSDYIFRPEKDSGGLDWGRGAWTYENRWYWSSASGMHEGSPLGFNLGYGFSDRSPASENALFYRNRLHKLSGVSFHFDGSDYTRPWSFNSDDGRIELSFQPIVDRASSVNLLLIRSVQHQVFGRFSGRIRLDDGTGLELKDFLGFAEDVYNRW